MRKIAPLALLIAAFGPLGHAGTMGEIETMDSEGCTTLSSFISLEGGYTWNQVDGYNYTIVGSTTRLTSVENNQGISGRLAAGLLKPINEQLGFSSEIGYGYYGKSTYNPLVTDTPSTIPGSIVIQNTLTGFDALAGLVYNDANFIVFLKAGALVQNMGTKTTADFSAASLPVLSSFTESVNHTAALPEVKLGLGYNFDTNLSLFASYFHVFGSNPEYTGSINFTTGATNFVSDYRNPTMDTVMVGIQYNA